jgi:hypothetical protein
VEKSNPKFRATCAFSKKLARVSNHPIGEKRPIWSPCSRSWGAVLQNHFLNRSSSPLKVFDTTALYKLIRDVCSSFKDLHS